MTDDAPSIDTSVPDSELHATVNPHDVKRLKGKTAIVTGSTRGIGEGIARRFASEGASVVVSGRTVTDGERVAADITDAGGEATFVEADMADPDAIERLVQTTADRYGTIDALVNNAAAWRHGPFGERTIDDWDVVMDVSLRAPWLATKHALEHMPAGGSVVNVSSVHALATDPGHFPYNVAKGGLNSMTRSMAVDCSPLDVRVNALLPGPVRVEGGDETLDDDPETDAARERLIPTNRTGVPEDVASFAAFLASDEAVFVTGATLTVDGGWTACLFDKRHLYGDLEPGV